MIHKSMKQINPLPSSNTNPFWIVFSLILRNAH
jgi:hypothetical protein